MGDDFGAFDVAQEFEAEALALGCARNQARYVGDGVAHVAGHHYAEVRHERGERIIGDLRFGGAHRRDQARLACGRKAHQRHVGDGLEFEDDVAFLARLAQQCEARRTTGAIGQRRIAETTVAARGHDELVSCVTQVASCSPGCFGLPCGPLASNTTVPTGTGRIRSAPFEPSFVSPRPMVPLSASRWGMKR